MRAIVSTPNRYDHLLFAMAADAVARPFEFGFELEFVDSSSQLLAVLDRALLDDRLPDAVIVHVGGADDGIAAVRAIDAHPILWPTPTVVLSAEPSDGERLRAYAAGALWYQRFPTGFSAARSLLAELPDRLAASAELVDRGGVIDLAAADLVDEIEAFLAGDR